MKIFLIAIGIFLIMFLATSIDAYNQDFLREQGISGLNKDIFDKTLGGFKDYVSDMSFLKADMYFHGGIYGLPECEECLHRGGLHLVEEKEDADTGEHIRKHENEAHEIRPSLNILLDIGRLTHITEHRHLSGKEEKEIVPWIYYAVRLNPHNELAYSVGGYWLARRLEKGDEAIKFLKKGLADNPESWEICGTLGEIYFFNKKNYEKAKIYLEKAKELGDNQNIDRFGRKKIHVLLNEAYKRMDNANPMP